MRMKRDTKIILAIAEYKGLIYVTKDSKDPHTMFRGNNIYVQANTQKELIEKLKTVLFDEEFEKIVDSIK
jgi:23S rRNA maturation mini-RNase III